MKRRMTKGFVGVIAGVTVVAVLSAGTAGAALALESDGRYYSSKQPYVAPYTQTTASYSTAPEGYTPKAWPVMVLVACPVINTTRC